MKKIFLLMSSFLVCATIYAQCISGGVLQAKTGTKTTICAGTNNNFFEVIEVTGTELKYTWTAPSGTTISGSGSAIELQVSNSVIAGTKDKLKVIVSSSNCSETIEKEIELTWNDVPDVTGASIIGLQNICVGDITLQNYEVTGVKNAVDYGWFALNKTQPLVISQTSQKIVTNVLVAVKLDETEQSREITILVGPKNECGTSKTEVTGTLTVFNNPSKAVLSDENLKVCVADKIFLTGNKPVIGTGFWTKTSTQSGTIVQANNPTTEITGLFGGETFMADWTISNGVCPSSKMIVNVESFSVADPTVALFLDKTVVCQGKSVTATLQGDVHGTAPVYEFIDGIGNVLQQGSSNTYTFSPTETIEIKGKVTSSSNCVVMGHETTESPLQKITVDPKPSKPVIISPTILPYKTCINGVDIEATITSGTLKWELVTNTTAIIDDVNASKTKVSNLEAMKNITLRALVTSGICPAEETSFDIELINVMTAPLLKKDFSVCKSNIPIEGYTDILIIGANANATLPETGSWSVVQGMASVSPQGIVTNLQVGKNVIAYEINNGSCPTNIDRITITIIDDEQCKITSLSAKETSDLVIYPNPFSTSITLNHIPIEIEKIRLVDVYGNVVEEVLNPSETIEMGQTLSSGTYFVQLHSAANVTTQKVIKIN